MAGSSNRGLVLIPIVAVAVLAAVWSLTRPEALVVYCAHDAEYSQQILDEFTRQTGIPVQVRFDTEATKSLGLIQLIVRERQQPRCDVFWNNELLGMVDLQEQGLLEPYQGSGWQRIPEQFRDADGCWVGFAARMRVSLFNTKQATATDETLETLLSQHPERVAIAKPLFGTTLTHYTVLWHLWGPERLQAWHRDLVARGVRVVDGNAAVKDLVAMGACDAGLTDNDDAFVALDDHLPVEMLPVRVMQGPDAISTHANAESPDGPERGEVQSRFTICIPNTAGIIRGTKKIERARKLIDFLASAETELTLARSKARQIPLGPVERTQLPDEVRDLAEWSHRGIDLRPLLPDRRACLQWLKDEYIQ